MMGTLLMIIKKVMECINGMILRNMKVIGRIVNNMVLDCILMERVFRGKVNGRMVRESNGWMIYN